MDDELSWRAVVILAYHNNASTREASVFLGARVIYQLANLCNRFRRKRGGYFKCQFLLVSKQGSNSVGMLLEVVPNLCLKPPVYSRQYNKGDIFLPIHCAEEDIHLELSAMLSIPAISGRLLCGYRILEVTLTISIELHIWQ